MMRPLLFLSLLATLCEATFNENDVPSCARSCVSTAAQESLRAAGGHCEGINGDWTCWCRFSQLPVNFEECLKSAIALKCSDEDISTAVNTLVDKCNEKGSAVGTSSRAAAAGLLGLTAGVFML
ncbi:hypothetical protein EXIGLDRAFT_701934 [Exidia glandulosa HHB12029]|uniref:CFEM domain-containing protein n=1 Tax=Exidia glandulosa HHB12029 TaxID=1314781 RepID=A0A165LNS2_EXIGL|nr:hypothetical protein EXIGLDRAFT_701934 [Exidia glandulosa HHB12029]